MPLSWFDFAWPWIGLVPAAAIVIVLFGTEWVAGGDLKRRWRDPAWTGWLIAATYMVHQFEEYGIDATGLHRAFPAAMCGVLGYAAEACPVPPAFYLAVNIPLTWIAAPIAALLARRLPLVGLGFAGLLLVNGLTHLVPTALGHGYDAGALTAALLFLPLSFVVARTFFWHGPFARADGALVIVCGALIQGVLIASLLAGSAG